MSRDELSESTRRIFGPEKDVEAFVGQVIIDSQCAMGLSGAHGATRGTSAYAVYNRAKNDSLSYEHEARIQKLRLG